MSYTYNLNFFKRFCTHNFNFFKRSHFFFKCTAFFKKFCDFWGDNTSYIIFFLKRLGSIEFIVFFYIFIRIFFFTNFYNTLYFFILSLINVNLENFIFIYLLEWFVLIISILFVNFLGVKGFFLFNWFTSLLLVVFLGIIFIKINIFQKIILIDIGAFFKFSHNSTISICIFIDYISYNFCFLTSIIALFIYMYTYSYMRHELNIINFFFFLKSFVLSMLLLLLAGNWVTLLLGWELIGLTSFFLINFWTNKITTLKSAFKAFSFNKLSDCTLIISFLLLQYFHNSFFFNFNASNSIYLYKYILLFNSYISFIDVILLFLVISAFCKSAQFGFHFWLPDSMEAPVPASALIHSATLVSAGIYLLLRYNYLFIFTGCLMDVFLIITTFTAFYGAIISCFQTDVKKILAYSTISHCGFLMTSLYFTNPYITILYLYGHGFYKSLSFMCVGNLIQSSFNYQDVRRMGNYLFYNIFEFFFLFICIFNLSSLPFFFNFFTKHFFLSNVNSLSLVKLISITFIYLAAFCGIFYSIRLVSYSFLTFKKNFHTFYKIISLDNKNNLFIVRKILSYNLKICLNKANLFGIIAMLLLFFSNIIVFNFFLIIFLNNFSIFLDNSSSLINFIYSNNNLFNIKIIFFYITYLFIWLFINFKKNNLFELQYIWVYYALLLLINFF